MQRVQKGIVMMSYVLKRGVFAHTYQIKCMLLIEFGL